MASKLNSLKAILDKQCDSWLCFTCRNKQKGTHNVPLTIPNGFSKKNDARTMIPTSINELYPKVLAERVIDITTDSL